MYDTNHSVENMASLFLMHDRRLGLKAAWLNFIFAGLHLSAITVVAAMANNTQSFPHFCLWKNWNFHHKLVSLSEPCREETVTVNRSFCSF